MRMSIEEWLEGPAERLHGAWMRARVPLLIVTAVNLTVLIVVLSVNMRGTQRFVESRMFVGLEEPPEEAAARKAQELAERQATMNRGWASEMRATEVRNVAVDASQQTELDAGLHDEKNIDAEKLYEDAARVRAEMAANGGRMEDQDLLGEVDVPNTEKKEVQAAEGKLYAGPSVVSYSLKGRKARRLPVPAYKCEMGGPVVVDIVVNGEGLVVLASIDAANSSGDACLRGAALQAAQRSVFNAVGGGAAQVVGSITYMFVAQ